MGKSSTRRLAYGGLMAALIALLTAYVRLDILFFLSMRSDGDAACRGKMGKV